MFSSAVFHIIQCSFFFYYFGHVVVRVQREKIIQLLDLFSTENDCLAYICEFCTLDRAAFYADANELFNNSSVNEFVWDSRMYYPPIETSSGVYYYNYWNEYEYCYAAVYYGFQHSPELYQPFVANVYGELPNDFQTMYYNNPAYYDMYDYPVAVHFVPVICYPVYYVPVTYIAIDVPSQYHHVYDLSYPNDCQYTISENSVGILSNFSAYETVSAAETTFEIFYEEEGERLNDAPLNNDDKKEIDENKSTSCHPKAMCKEDSSLEAVDLDYEDEISELCREFEKLSLYDNEENSSSSKPNDNSSEDLSSNSDDNSFEDLSSSSDDNSVVDSPSSDSDVDNDTALIRQGNIMDLHQIDDYTQSAFDTSPSSGDKKIITEENSEVECEVHELSGQSYIDMILSSEEYLYIQDNLENPKLYKDYLYRKSLKKNPRREKTNLFDVLPTIEEESTPLMDDTPVESEDEIYVQDRVIESHEMISSVEDEPVTSKMKQPKRRFKTFKKWLSKTFCCCCTTKDPP